MSLKFGKLSGGDVKLSTDDDGHVRGRVRVRDFFFSTNLRPDFRFRKDILELGGRACRMHVGRGDELS